MGTLMEELNAKAIAPGVQPDLIWRCNEGASIASLDHDGAGEMTFEGSTICSRRNWPMPASFSPQAHRRRCPETPEKIVSYRQWSIGTNYYRRTAVLFPYFPGENPLRSWLSGCVADGH